MPKDDFQLSLKKKERTDKRVECANNCGKHILPSEGTLCQNCRMKMAADTFRECHRHDGIRLKVRLA